MARKKSSGDSGALNLDSLMDALTNVVAVLILVLLLVNLDVTKKMVEIFEDLEPATEEDIRKSMEDLSKLEIQQRDLETLLKEKPPTPEEIAEIKRQIEQIKIQVVSKNDDQKSVSKSLEELKLRLAAAKAERDQEQQKTVTMQEEIRRLEMLLDTTPVVEGIPPTEVKIPNSRPIPENAIVYIAMVRNGRIHLLPQLDDYFALIQKELRAKKKDLVVETQKKGNKEILTYDQLKLAALFKGFDFKPQPGQKIELRVIPWGKGVQLLVTPDFINAGTTLDQLKQKSNPFTDAVNKLRSNSKSVIMFQVEPESYDAYLAARSIVDDKRVPAGWVAATNSVYVQPVPDVLVLPTATPPPAAKNVPEQPGRLKLKLD
jgi:hypothetical protein